MAKPRTGRSGAGAKRKSAMRNRRERDPFEALIKFLRQLDDLKVSYQLMHVKVDAALTVVVSTLEEYYEVHFGLDGTIETERFRSEQWIEGDAGPEEIIDWWTESKAETTEAPEENARSRKRT